MNAIDKVPHSDRYARCIETSKRMRWDIEEDVIRGRPFDVAHKFLGPAVGAMFKGTNKRGIAWWSTTNSVVAATPGEEFSFETKQSGTRWTYRIQPDGAATLVTETRAAFKERPLVARFFSNVLLGGVDDHDEELRDGMQQTLERLKAVAETPDHALRRFVRRRTSAATPAGRSPGRGGGGVEVGLGLGGLAEAAVAPADLHVAVDRRAPRRRPGPGRACQRTWGWPASRPRRRRARSS